MKRILLFVCLYAVGMYLSLNMNSKYKPLTYKSTMWADAAGYYLYLPATFIYNWQYDQLPDSIDTKTGNGFAIRKDQQIIFTKYTSGLTFLQAPFFFAAHAYCKLSGTEANGFTQPYVNGMLFSGVFYLMLGLFLLYAVMRHYFTNTATIMALFAIFACTNLYYYSIEHPGLSHVYTFFLASLLLYLIQHFSAKKMLLIIPLCALILLIRPTNITLVAALIGFGLVVKGKGILQTVPFKYYLIGVLLSLPIILPQLFYWHYASGHWLMYSYGNEGFIYWKNPQVLKVLFAANNGFITYSPIIIFALIGLYFKPLGKQFSWLVLGLFVIITYVHASWWSWGFGCAYGGRSFIDFYPFFVFGLAALIQMILKQSRPVKIACSIVGIALIAYNILFIYGYDDCWYSTDWDYSYILTVLKG
ncbi:MAG: hypothetical protein V4613_05655 [Bacteroidota bacterium]